MQQARVVQLVRGACFFVFAATFGMSTCWAQLSSAGTISGTVTDKSGALVPQAAVSIVNTETGVQTTTQTNKEGSFTAPGLAPGRYSVTISKEGFQTYVVQDVRVHPALVATVNAALEVGQQVARVEVNASVAQVETSTGEISSEVSQQQVATLPLNGRNYQGLAALIPGTVNIYAGTALNQGGRLTRNAMSINGMSAAGTLYTVDGMYMMNTGNMAQTTVTPNPDTIQEVRALQNNYGVPYSLLGANVVLLQTKSGTDTFHVSGFEYFRNDALDARNFFSPTVPALKQNIFGYTIGGPLYIPGHYNSNRQKTFFFWSQQFPIQHVASVLRGATPTADMRNGLFPDPITNPQTGQPFAQNGAGQYQIPQSMLNSSSLALLNAQAPLPNNPSGGFLNYINLTPRISNQRDDEIKIDHNFTGKLRLMVEYLDERQTLTYPNLPALGSGNVFGTNHEVDKTQNQLAQIRLVALPTPSMVNTTSVNMNNYVLYLNVAGLTQRSQVPGFQEALPYSGFGSNRLPYIQISGGWSPLGMPIARPLSHASDLENTVSDDWNWLRGSHFIEGGLNIVLGTKRQTAYAGASNGQWIFTGQFTGDPIADYLLGDPLSFTQASTSPRYYGHYPVVSPYIQDRWKATRRLTVTVGVRLQYMPLPHAQHGFEAIFDPAKFNPSEAPIVNPDGTITTTPNYNTSNGLIVNGMNGVPLNFSNIHNFFWAPSFGFAYDVFGDGKTALRGGYGITYTRVPFSGSDCIGSCAVNPPLVNSLTLITPSFPSPIGAGVAPTGAPTLNSQDLDLQPARIQSFSLSLQHEFPGNWFVSIAGAGVNGQHSALTPTHNQPLPDPPYDYNPIINAGTVFPYIYGPFQGYGPIYDVASIGRMNWEGLEVSARHPVGSNLFLTAAYTWSHDLSDDRATEMFQGSANPLQDIYHPHNEYGTSTIDLTHVLSCSYIWSLPGHQLRGWKGAALGDWKYSGIVAIESGFPADPALSVAQPGLALRPDRVGSVKGPKTVNEWFNTDAFVQAPPGYFGNAGTGIIRGPGLVNFDMAFYKVFHIRERHTFEFRAELFNIFNHTNFNGIDPALGSGTFGQVISAADPRITEFALRYEF